MLDDVIFFSCGRISRIVREEERDSDIKGDERRRRRKWRKAKVEREREERKRKEEERPVSIFGATRQTPSFSLTLSFRK